MTFKIVAEPSFKAEVVIVGQGRSQTLNLTYRNKTNSEQVALIESLKTSDGTDADLVLALVQEWDADMPLTLENVRLLGEHQPGALAAILEAYTEARQVARQKN